MVISGYTTCEIDKYSAFTEYNIWQRITSSEKDIFVQIKLQIGQIDNSPDASGLRRHAAQCDVTVMSFNKARQNANCV